MQYPLKCGWLKQKNSDEKNATREHAAPDLVGVALIFCF